MRRTTVLLSYLFCIFLLTACGGGGGSSDSDAESAGTQPTSDSQSTELKLGCGTMEAPLRVMPLGDSITESLRGFSSYRQPLYDLLINASCVVDFVGSRRGVSEGFRDSAQVSPRNPNFDQDHEGHWDYRADEILSRIPNWIRQNPADVVLIHLGTNDLFQSQSVASTLNEIEAIIGALRAANPSIRIAVAQLIPSSRKLDKIQFFNSQVPDLVSALNTSASPIVLVDQFSDFFVSGDTSDGVHPSSSGEVKMASNWFNAIMELGFSSM